MSTINGLPNTQPIERFQWQTPLLNLLIWAAWGWLFRPIFPYLQYIFTKNDFRTNQVLLLLIVGLIGHQVYERGLDVEGWGTRNVQVRRWPLFVAIGSAIVFLLIERFLAVNTLSAAFFALGGYGLLGLWISPTRWRHGLPAALLIVGTLPFSHHMQTFIGYPMRIATAAIVRDGLSIAGIGHVGIDTILILENGISHIDLPCSGVQSLWTGIMFLLAATWLEGKKVANGWWLVASALLILLFVSNLARVAILTITGSVYGWTLFAEMLHVPLGVFGFVLACAAALWLLRWVPSHSQEAPSPSRFAKPQREGLGENASIRAILIAALFIGLSFIHTKRALAIPIHTAPERNFGETIQTENLPLKPYEEEMLTRDGAESAERLTFQSGNLTGSMIIITSSTWRAHHSPERCFEVYGLAIDKSFTHLVDPTFPIRLVTLGEGTYTANYWFQSAETTTDDYATRIWDDLQRERDRWVLVSMIFDGEVDVNSAEVVAFYKTVHNTVAETLVTSNQSSVISSEY